MFNFTSLLGAQSTSPASQSLIELEGGVKILVDVGWDESFDVALLKELEKQVPTLSLILLTHATTSHLAAFAYCCKYFPSFTSIPIYATAPVISLGRSLLQDLYSSTPLAASIIPSGTLYESTYSAASFANRTSSNILFQQPSTEEIAGFFALIHPLKYSQPHEPVASPFSPPLNGLTITAYSAGHSLGGTIWHIQHGLESIVYAVDWNQAKESALQGAAWLGAGGGEVIESLRRPTALICSSRASQRVVLSGGRERRDEQMIKLIRETIAKGGIVVIPSDSCARVLEISYFLEAAWSRDQDSGKRPDSLRNASLYLASASSGLTMRYARSMLEWMDEDVVREFESAAQSGGRQQEGNQQKNPKAPFDFQFLRMIERTKQLNRVLSQDGPKVIIATDLSMEWGFARRLFETISADSRNLLILPEPIIQTATGRKNIGHSLWNLWSQRSSSSTQELTEESLTSIIETDGSPITYSEAHTEKLEGNELIAYQQYLARERQRQRTNNTDKTTTLETGADLIDDGSSSSSEESEESDAEHQGKVLNVSTTLTHSRHKLGLTDAELGIDILIRRKGHYDYDVRGKRGRERMFPVLPTKRNPRNDDFGDVIRPEDYLRAEERENVEGQEALGAKADKEQTLGQKRRWNEVTAQSTANGRGASNGAKRHKSHDGFGADSSRMDVDGVTTNGNAIEDLDDSDDDLEEQQEGPMKAVFGTKTLDLHVRIAHVDFSGLHDKRSMQMLIPMIRPRKLVLVGGDQRETLALAAECEKLLGTGVNITADTAAEVLTPLIGQTLDASVDTNAWNVKLSLSLRRQLHWQNVGGLGVVPLTSHLSVVQREEQHGGNGKPKRLKNGSTDADQAEEDDVDEATYNVAPLLDVVPANKAAATRIVARPFHVGDLRLSDLRKLMQSQGYPAEFRGEGTLLVNGMVAIRKNAVGKVEVETVIGIPGFSVTDPTFDDVRRRIYDGLLAVVSVS